MSARTESRGAFYFYSLHDSQFHIVGKAPVLSLTRAVLADVQAYDDMGVLRFMTAKDGKPCKKCGNSEWYKGGGCASCDREKSRKWREANPGKNAEASRKWRAENPDKNAISNRRWRESHQEKFYGYIRNYRQKNQVATKAIKHRRRTRKTRAGGSYTVSEWNALVNHFGNKCLCCGRDDVKLTADHIIPISKGGTSNIDNIQPLCFSCNSSKCDKTIDYRPNVGLGRWIQRKLFG